jgi:CDP-diacylglycerol--serine O-phosphatidyltransferase
MQKTNELTKIKQPGMLNYVKDLPNICSLIGLLCALLGIYFAILGNFEATMIAVLWAVLFDWYDGIIARKLKGRTKTQGVFGAQLDSMIDIVSFGILPAIVLLSYGNYNLWFLPGAFVIFATSAVRLSYFNVFGLIDSKTYKGLSLDNNVLILALLFLFDSFFEHAIFAVVVYVVLMLLSAFNLSSILFEKELSNRLKLLVIFLRCLVDI